MTCYDGAVCLENCLGLQYKYKHFSHAYIIRIVTLNLLSLTVKDVTKAIMILRDIMGTAGEIIILIKYSPKSENLLEKLKG